MSTEGPSHKSPRWVNGSILSNFSRLELSTADEKKYSLNMTPVNRLAMNIIGIPHLGFRLRARIVLSEARKADSAGKVLDAGCGYGLYAMSLGELGYKVDAIDVDVRRIKALRSMIAEYPVLKDRLMPFTGSLTSLPFPAQSYDTIVCSEVIEHIREDGQAVSELARVIKPTGTLILSVPYDSTYNKKVYKRFDHERPGYNRDSIGSILEKRGFSIEKVLYYERAVGRTLFDTFNAIKSKPLMALLFYPFYFLYLIDYYIGFGEPSQMVVVAKKS